MKHAHGWIEVPNSFWHQTYKHMCACTKGNSYCLLLMQACCKIVVALSHIDGPAGELAAVLHNAAGVTGWIVRTLTCWHAPFTMAVLHWFWSQTGQQGLGWQKTKRALPCRELQRPDLSQAYMSSKESGSSTGLNASLCIPKHTTCQQYVLNLDLAVGCSCSCIWLLCCMSPALSTAMHELANVFCLA